MVTRYSFLYTVLSMQIPRFLCMKNLKPFILILIVIFIDLGARKVVQQQVVASIKELVHGKQFSYAYQLIDGVRKEWWSIDGRSVDKLTYEEEILSAEKEELRQKREQMYADQEEELSTQQRLRRGLLKKLLRVSISYLDQSFAQLSEYQLQGFIVYGSHTFTKDRYENFVQQVLPQARDLMKQGEPSLVALQSMVDQCEESVSLMKRLVQEAIEVAVQQCDDTVLLKRLLNLL